MAVHLERYVSSATELDALDPRRLLASRVFRATESADAAAELRVAGAAFVRVRANALAELRRYRSARARLSACREQQIGGSAFRGLIWHLNPQLGLFLNPFGLVLTHLHTVYMVCSECLPTRLNPLVERTCFSQAERPL